MYYMTRLTEHPHVSFQAIMARSSGL